jgi:hypothetical protein
MQVATKPTLRGDDLRRTLDQQTQQLVELQPGKIRKRQLLARPSSPGAPSGDAR